MGLKVGVLRKWLEQFPDQCDCWAYEGEVTGIIVSWKKAPQKLKKEQGCGGDEFCMGNRGSVVTK